MPGLAGVAMELRHFINPNRGDRHDHREEGSTKEAELVRVGHGTGKCEQSFQDHGIFSAAVLRDSSKFSDFLAPRAF